MDIDKAKCDDSVLKSNRMQICGGSDFSLEVLDKIKRVQAKNQKNGRTNYIMKGGETGT